MDKYNHSRIFDDEDYTRIVKAIDTLIYAVNYPEIKQKQDNKKSFLKIIYLKI